MAAGPLITLKKLEGVDMKAMMIWAIDERVTSATAWESFTCEQEASNFLYSVASKHPFFKAICVDGHPVGALSVTPDRGQLGYVLAADYWGRGITTQAVRLAIPLAFQQLGLSRFEAFVFPENVPSQRVLLKAGFKNFGLQYVLFKKKSNQMLPFLFIIIGTRCYHLCFDYIHLMDGRTRRLGDEEL